MSPLFRRIGTHRPPSAHRARTVLVPLAAAAVAVGTGAVAVAATGDDDAATARFRPIATWADGYAGQYTISAGADPVQNWVVEFDLPAGSSVRAAWDGTERAHGRHYTIRSPKGGHALAAGGSATAGFVVTGTGLPRNCTINGNPCERPSSSPTPGGGTPTASSAPTGTGRPSASASPSASTAPSRRSGTETASAGAGGKYGFAPYLDTDQTQDVAGVAQAEGTKYVTLAFMLANGTQCDPAWNGAARDDAWVKKITTGIAELRADGGDVIQSFGGAAGTELAQACSSVDSLTKAYQTVIDAEKLTHVDFDIEGAASGDQASVDRRSQAIAALQKANPDLSVSLTLPVLPSGLTADGVDVLRSAKKYGATIDVVNVMAMDYGQDQAPDGDRMAEYAQQAATKTAGQVADAFGIGQSAAWGRIGITPMIGVNDQCWDSYCETFTLADASALRGFAENHGIGRIAMWSANRDRQCDGGAQHHADPSCSSIEQKDHAFGAVFGGYQG